MGYRVNNDVDWNAEHYQDKKDIKRVMKRFFPCRIKHRELKTGFETSAQAQSWISHQVNPDEWEIVDIYLPSRPWRESK